MYIVIEIQHNFDGTTGCIVNSYADRAVAEQKYHMVLSAAAVSAVYIHSAVMIDAHGTKLKSETYSHAEVNEDV